jgi:hypothetical protein
VAAQKRKSTFDTNQKGKKQSGAVVTKHYLHHPRPGYPEDNGRRGVLQKYLAAMGYRTLMDLPWRYVDDNMLKEIIARKAPSFPNSIWAKLDE